MNLFAKDKTPAEQAAYETLVYTHDVPPYLAHWAVTEENLPERVTDCMFFSETDWQNLPEIVP